MNNDRKEREQRESKMNEERKEKEQREGKRTERRKKNKGEMEKEQREHFLWQFHFFHQQI